MNWMIMKNFHGLLVKGFRTEDELLRAYANSSTNMYVETEDGTLSSTVLAGIVFQNANGDWFPENIEVN